MLIENGNKKLQDFTDRSFHETYLEVTEGIWHVSGLGHSNAIFVEGESQVILIDTLDSLERGKKLLDFIRKQTGKEVKTIIYTHGHPDHRGGAGAFLGSQPEIIAFAPKTPVLERTEVFRKGSAGGKRGFGRERVSVVSGTL